MASEFTSSRLNFDDWESAQDYYFDNGLTDGLPIVPPTEERVEAMLSRVGMAPDHVIAVESIRHKSFIAEKMAVNAVMAGCKPEYFPVVVAGVAAVCERQFNFHASSGSTNGVCILAVVSGPYANEIGMNSETGLMGNGTRANATIGRALNLIKSNFYGSVAGDMDKSTFGHSGKFSFCFAERLQQSPWPPLAVSKGFGEGASTVTLYAANAPLQVSVHGDKAPEDILTCAAHAMEGLGPSLPEVLVVISPELMDHVAEAGWSREQVADFLYAKTQHPAKEWLAWHRIDQREKAGDGTQLIGCVPEPGRITVVPAGGTAGAFIDLVPGWGSSRSVTKEIRH